MIKIKEALTSSIGRKVLNGLTAFALVFFVIGHLGGNLTLMVSPEAFNAYGAKLHSLGWLLYAVEIGLLAVIVIHAFTGIALSIKNLSTRSSEYRAKQTSKGGPSNFGFSSVWMIVSGLVLLMFLGIHLFQFRMRPFYTTEAKFGHHEYYKHLYEMVDTAFADPVCVVAYPLVMVFLRVHLRHGIWSMFQTVGAMNSRWKQTIYGLALVLALLLAAGFFILPIGLYLDYLPLGA